MKIIWYILSTLCVILNARLAVIVDPVVDGFTVSALKYGSCVQKVHNNLDYVPSKFHPTPRSCQLLFNTIVNTLKETPHEAMIEVGHLFYEIEPDDSYKNIFWIPKKSLLFLDHVNEVTRQSFPKPLSFTQHYWNDNHVIVLTLPWKSSKNFWYSVGTRFVRDPQHDTGKGYAVIIRHPHHIHAQHEEIPKSHAMIEGTIPQVQKRNAMIQLIRKWIRFAERYNDCIPYVWGGSSFAFGQKQKKPLRGFDCSSLIVRSAQMVSVPLAGKTSMMMEKTLKPLTKTDKLEVGDIIWRPGHVILISDLKNNKIIQARGYESGYGCVYESKLSDYFEGIKTFNQLLKTYFNKQQVRELKKNGESFTDTTEFKILKLPV